MIRIILLFGNKKKPWRISGGDAFWQTGETRSTPLVCRLRGQGLRSVFKVQKIQGLMKNKDENYDGFGDGFDD